MVRYRSEKGELSHLFLAIPVLRVAAQSRFPDPGLALRSRIALTLSRGAPHNPPKTESAALAPVPTRACAKTNLRKGG
jgi:hypothetical protein